MCSDSPSRFHLTTFYPFTLQSSDRRYNSSHWNQKPQEFGSRVRWNLRMLPIFFPSGGMTNGTSRKDSQIWAVMSKIRHALEATSINSLYRCRRLPTMPSSSETTVRPRCGLLSINVVIPLLPTITRRCLSLFNGQSMAQCSVVRCQSLHGPYWVTVNSIEGSW